MADLIDRDALLKDLQSECHESNVCFSHESCINCIVKRQPTIEPEVRHGRWIEDGEVCGIDKYKCSLCGGEVGGLLDNTKYCCFCGAKMNAIDTEVDKC